MIISNNSLVIKDCHAVQTFWALFIICETCVIINAISESKRELFFHQENELRFVNNLMFEIVVV